MCCRHRAPIKTISQFGSMGCQFTTVEFPTSGVPYVKGKVLVRKDREAENLNRDMWEH